MNREEQIRVHLRAGYSVCPYARQAMLTEHGHIYDANELVLPPP